MLGFNDGTWLTLVDQDGPSGKEFKKRSKMSFNYLVQHLGPKLVQPLKQFYEKEEPARLAWDYLTNKFSTRDFHTQAAMNRRLDNLRMDDEERNEDYVTRALKYKEELDAGDADSAVSERKFCNQLLAGLLDEPRWAIFKSLYGFRKDLAWKELEEAFESEQRQQDEKDRTDKAKDKL